MSQPCTGNSETSLCKIRARDEEDPSALISASSLWKTGEKQNELRKCKSTVLSPSEAEAKLLLSLYLNAEHGFHDGNNNLLTKCFYWIAFTEEALHAFSPLATIKSSSKQSLSIEIEKRQLSFLSYK